MKERVRAVLVTPKGTTLLVKRVRPGVDRYWAIVGGGVEESDATREEALLREVREEIAGDAEIVRLLHEMENAKGEKECFYLARVNTWDFENRPARSLPGVTEASTSSRKSRSPPRPSPT